MWGLEEAIQGDIKYGTLGRVGLGRGTSNTGTRDVNDYSKSRR